MDVDTPKASFLQDVSAGNSFECSSHSYFSPSDPELPISHLFTSSASSTSPFFISLRANSSQKPIYVNEDGRIFLETFSPAFSMAQDFLIAISEPVSRPNIIHEYQITPYSLYAAVSVGLETDAIIDVLDRFSKTELPTALVSFIRTCTLSYGKVKLVLHQGRYWIETAFPDIIQMLLKDPIIAEARKSLPPSSDNYSLSLAKDSSIDIPFSEETNEIENSTFSFEIPAGSVELVKRRCIEIDYPMLEEYDFLNDLRNFPLDIHLTATTSIRPYQEVALSKMFGNARARSGIIVLPCGAGKTLVGIAATSTIKKSTLVLCTSGVAVEQWYQQFRQFSTISPDLMARFTSSTKESSIVINDDDDHPQSALVIITTYTMVAFSGKRSYEAQRMMTCIKKIEWGLLLLDEVHVVPANVFRRVLTTVAAHSKLGLTATLVREDDKIADLNFLIGPKLYEANWLDLSRQGHIATVKCSEIWCPMTSDFYREYLGASGRRRRLFYVMNPNKFQACQYLIDSHEKKGDKIIVFSDNVYALKAYALKLKKPFIYGPTSQVERMRILHQFQNNPNLNTIFLSKVGDTSIDLPEATCLIQISSHYGSRRQEAQRLGRILRAKRRMDDGFNAYFYSLVSKDTEEMFYSTKRQQFLIDQGYTFKVITELEGMKKNRHSLVYSTQKEQLELLKCIILASETEVAEDENLGTSADDIDGPDTGYVSSEAQLRASTSPHKSLSSLTGGSDLVYVEKNKRISTAVASTKGQSQQTSRHSLFKAYFKSKK
ncbi:DNA repair helicase RAD25 [Mitosporidium daphniae]